MAIQVRNDGAEGASRAARMPIIDTDVHAQAGADAVAARLPKRWQKYVWGGRYQKMNTDLIRVRAGTSRTDAWPPDGGLPGSDPDFIAKQLLDAYDLDFAIADAISVGSLGTGPIGYTEAICRANNEWMAEELLDRDPRWRASMNLAYEFGGRAVVPEIERWAADGRFVSVALSMRIDRPLGDPKYWDMFEACEEFSLPVALHPGHAGGHQVTGSGWPSFYFEDHMGYPQVNAVHIASMICEGVFDRFPKLRVVILEGGWSWVGWLSERFDASLRVMADEVSLRRLPSEYIQDHFWYSSQPIEEPENPTWLPKLITDPRIIDRLMYSSDYPHWDFDSPLEAIPDSIPDEARQKIFHGNARELFGLTIEDGDAR